MLPTPRVVPKAEAIDNLHLWEAKGFSILEAIRVFGVDGLDGIDRGELMVGFTDYTDLTTVLVPAHMNRPYANYQQAFTAIGALIDVMKGTAGAADEPARPHQVWGPEQDAARARAARLAQLAEEHPGITVDELRARLDDGQD